MHTLRHTLYATYIRSAELPMREEIVWSDGPVPSPEVRRTQDVLSELGIETEMQISILELDQSQLVVDMLQSALGDLTMRVVGGRYVISRLYFYDGAETWKHLAVLRLIPTSDGIAPTAEWLLTAPGVGFLIDCCEPRIEVVDALRCLSTHYADSLVMKDKKV